jgi:hypothetical protein
MRAAASCLALALALILGTPALGQAPGPVPPPAPAPVVALPVASITLSPPAPVLPGKLVTIDASASVGDDFLFDTDVPDDLYVPDTGGRKLYFSSPVPGTYPFKVEAFGIVNGRVKASRAKVTVIVRAPDPPPVIDPPKPVDPPAPPAPAPAPSAAGNMRVVLLYESAAAISPAQHAVIYSTTSVIPYLESKTIKGSDGRHEWRFWDKDVNVAAESAEWRACMATAKADPVAIPKVVVFAGTTLVGSRTLVSEADTLSYLQSLGGK